MTREIYIQKQPNGRFRVLHNYMPTPTIDEPSSFDERNEATTTVGEADTRKEAERIVRNYRRKLKREAEQEEDDE